jgi:putative addiction module component (TIGR02574 family)
MEAKMPTILEQAIHLSVEEKLDLISALWDSMAEHPDNIPVSDWQLNELARRIEGQQKDRAKFFLSAWKSACGPLHEVQKDFKSLRKTRAEPLSSSSHT